MNMDYNVIIPAVFFVFLIHGFLKGRKNGT